DVWTDPAVRTPDVSFGYSYNDAVQFHTAAPTTSACSNDPPSGPSAWKANCRITINYLTHIQALWDLPRQTVVRGTVTSDHTSTQARCRTPPPAPGATAMIQVPAGQLNLTTDASNVEPAQPESYRDLLFQHDQLEVIMDALQPVPDPNDPNGGALQVPAFAN